MLQPEDRSLTDEGDLYEDSYRGVVRVAGRRYGIAGKVATPVLQRRDGGSRRGGDGRGGRHPSRAPISRAWTGWWARGRCLGKCKEGSPSSGWRVASSSSSASTSGSTDRGLRASRTSGTNSRYRARGDARLAGGRQRQRRYRGLERSRARVRLLVLFASTLYTAVVRIVGALCFGRDLATAVGER
jgi:hypothetical protein